VNADTRSTPAIGLRYLSMVLKPRSSVRTVRWSALSLRMPYTCRKRSLLPSTPLGQKAVSSSAVTTISTTRVSTMQTRLIAVNSLRRMKTFQAVSR
jgi:hypothetical protein